MKQVLNIALISALVIVDIPVQRGIEYPNSHSGFLTAEARAQSTREALAPRPDIAFRKPNHAGTGAITSAQAAHLAGLPYRPETSPGLPDSDAIGKKVIEFLSKHPDEAYPSDILAELVFPSMKDGFAKKVTTVLNELVTQEKIRKIVRTKDNRPPVYWAKTSRTTPTNLPNTDLSREFTLDDFITVLREFGDWMSVRLIRFKLGDIRKAPNPDPGMLLYNTSLNPKGPIKVRRAGNRGTLPYYQYRIRGQTRRTKAAT